MTRFACPLAVAVLALPALAFAQAAKPAAAPPKPAADEPRLEKYSAAKAAEFLDAVGGDWTQKRQCGTCHTNYPYIMARAVLRDIPGETPGQVRWFFDHRVLNWDMKFRLTAAADEKLRKDAVPEGVVKSVAALHGKPFADEAGFVAAVSNLITAEETAAHKAAIVKHGAWATAKPRWDAEVVSTAVVLAFDDSVRWDKLSEPARKALDRMWKVQKADGSWGWLKCDWPPYEHDDYFGAVFAAVGAGVAPEGYAQGESAKAGVAKLRGYLTKTPPPDLHHKTFLLWASVKLDGLMTAEQKQAAIKELLAAQRDDGGWSLPGLGTYKRRDGSPNDRNAPSDGYGTGLAVFVLRQAGLPADNDAIKKGAAWLGREQRASGRWWTRSLNNDGAHYISNAGTAWAVMALKACEPAKGAE